MTPFLEAVRQAEEIKAERLARKDYAGYLVWFGGHEKFQPFLEIHERLTDRQYWRLLADVWYNIEVSYPDRATWLQLFESERPGRELLMNARERRSFVGMPERLALYRGYAGGKARCGLSWTLSEDRAIFFCRGYARGGRRAGFGYEASQRPAMVATGWCHKHDVFAYFNQRQEQEIVVNPKSVFSLKARRL